MNSDTNNGGNFIPANNNVDAQLPRFAWKSQGAERYSHNPYGAAPVYQQQGSTQRLGWSWADEVEAAMEEEWIDRAPFQDLDLCGSESTATGATESDRSDTASNASGGDGHYDHYYQQHFAQPQIPPAQPYQYPPEVQKETAASNHSGSEFKIRTPQPPSSASRQRKSDKKRSSKKRRAAKAEASSQQPVTAPAKAPKSAKKSKARRSQKPKPHKEDRRKAANRREGVPPKIFKSPQDNPAPPRAVLEDPASRPYRSEAADPEMRRRWDFVFDLIMGQRCEVVTTDGTRYEGILHSKCVGDDFSVKVTQVRLLCSPIHGPNSRTFPRTTVRLHACDIVHVSTCFDDITPPFGQRDQRPQLSD